MLVVSLKAAAIINQFTMFIPNSILGAHGEAAFRFGFAQGFCSTFESSTFIVQYANYTFSFRDEFIVGFFDSLS